MEMTVLQTAGLSHSEISGSMAICAYPKLIAAYHVLLRLREPRHPPYALIFFIFASPAFSSRRIRNTDGYIYFQLYFISLFRVAHLAVRASFSFFTV
jgi:hypothetical protein